MRLKLCRFTLFVLLAVVVSSCIPPTPIVVIVTPTRDPHAAIQPSSTQTPSPTLTLTTTPTNTATITLTFTPSRTPVPVTPSFTPTGPTSTFGPAIAPNQTGIATATTTPPTATAGAPATGAPATTAPAIIPTTIPTVAPTLPASGPSATFGAVVGPNYTPPPTLTAGPPATIPPANVTLPPAATAGPSPTPGPVLRSALMGVQIHGYLTDAQWNQMLDFSKQLGVGWIKVQIQWKELEPAKGNYNQLYAAMVQNVQRARLAGFKTMISIAKAPGWSRPAGVVTQDDGPPTNPQDLADFITKLTTDIKPEFLDAVEVWNEPNLIREWRGATLNGGEYMKYFNAAYTAIQNVQKALPAADHRIMVITSGLAPTATTPGSSVNDRDYLRQMYAAGLAKYSDDVGIGAHPYGWANPPEATCCTASPGVTGWFADRSFYFRDTLDDYHTIMVNSGDATAKLWVTEFGWATYEGLKRSNGAAAAADPQVGWQTLINQQQQADYVLRAFYMAQKPPYYDYLGPIMLWNLNFATLPTMVDTSREEAGFSLLDQSVNPRPVYNTLKAAPKQ